MKRVQQGSDPTDDRGCVGIPGRHRAASVSGLHRAFEGNGSGYSQRLQDFRREYLASKNAMPANIDAGLRHYRVAVRTGNRRRRGTINVTVTNVGGNPTADGTLYKLVPVAIIAQSRRGHARLRQFLRSTCLRSAVVILTGINRATLSLCASNHDANDGASGSACCRHIWRGRLIAG
jgi:hypothetical protein